MRMNVAAFALLAAVAGVAPALANEPSGEPSSPPLDQQSIDGADFAGWRARVDAAEQAEAQARPPKSSRKQKGRPARPSPAKSSDAPDPFLIRAQILLDRAHISPGVIDGRNGDNLKKAVRAFEQLRGLPVDGEIDAEVWSALVADGGAAVKSYAITKEDVDGRYVETVPKDYAKLAKLKWVGYRDAAEMLAERFHMDERLLRTLNAGVDFKTEGQSILVAETGAAPTAKVARIIVEKKEGDLRGFDEAGNLVFVAPATVGSGDTPSPSGAMKVNGAFPDPWYKYDPKKNFQQGRNTRKLNIRPGPNGPVGSMWIDLTKPTYGIHGAPEPNDISKTSSHGCVRLTNWDAAELAGMVLPKKTTVEFR